MWYSTYSKYAAVSFKLLVLCAFCLQVVFVWQQPWSPIDEYAHMDYIERLSVAQMPAISDTLSASILTDIQQHPERSVGGIHDIDQLGLAQFSYQAKHPPLYYLLLAVPNSLMQLLDVSLFQRVMILRVLSVVLFMSGLLLFFPIARKLRNLKYEISATYVWFAILWCLMTVVHERYGLGNNLLSPLLCNAALLSCLQYNSTGSKRDIGLLSFFAALSVCGALTNVFLLPILFLCAIRTFFAGRVVLNFLMVMLGLVIPAGILWIWQAYSTPDPIVANWINDLIHLAYPAHMVGYRVFLSLLLNDLLTIHLFGYTLQTTLFHIVLFFVNLILFVAVWFRSSQPGFRWIWMSYACAAYWLFLLFILNRYVADVTWVAFRHYLGFYPFIVVAFSGGIYGMMQMLKDRRF
jgi:hypothetical protein